MFTILLKIWSDRRQKLSLRGFPLLFFLPTCSHTNNKKLERKTYQWTVLKTLCTTYYHICACHTVLQHNYHKKNCSKSVFARTASGLNAATINAVPIEWKSVSGSAQMWEKWNVLNFYNGERRIVARPVDRINFGLVSNTFWTIRHNVVMWNS